MKILHALNALNDELRNLSTEDRQEAFKLIHGSAAPGAPKPIKTEPDEELKTFTPPAVHVEVAFFPPLGEAYQVAGDEIALFKDLTEILEYPEDEAVVSIDEPIDYFESRFEKVADNYRHMPAAVLSTVRSMFADALRFGLTNAVNSSTPLIRFYSARGQTPGELSKGFPLLLIPTSQEVELLTIKPESVPSLITCLERHFTTIGRIDEREFATHYHVSNAQATDSFPQRDMDYLGFSTVAECIQKMGEVMIYPCYRLDDLARHRVAIDHTKALHLHSDVVYRMVQAATGATQKEIASRLGLTVERFRRQQKGTAEVSEEEFQAQLNLFESVYGITFAFESDTVVVRYKIQQP